jgi:hypothetical protein
MLPFLSAPVDVPGAGHLKGQIYRRSLATHGGSVTGRWLRIGPLLSFLLSQLATPCPRQVLTRPGVIIAIAPNARPRILRDVGVDFLYFLRSRSADNRPCMSGGAQLADRSSMLRSASDLLCMRYVPARCAQDWRPRVASWHPAGWASEPLAPVPAPAGPEALRVPHPRMVSRHKSGAR